jgi:ferric-dicitrate binding protein FerR (iron transport regulator)
MSRLHTYKKSTKDLLDQSSDLLQRTEISFARTKEEVWKDLSGMLGEVHSGQDATRRIGFNYQRLAMAATLAMLLAVGSFLRLYRETTVTLPGEGTTIELPDGSLAELNENTTLYYHPLWWSVSRKVSLEGEAFFEVKKGKQFNVRTSLGTTGVLGTTFTVLSRDNRFRVTCHSGQVRVRKASSKQSAILSMNERAELTSTGELEISTVRVERLTPAWESKLLMFASTPLRSVFDRIESQFGIRIETPEDLNYIYTGNFNIDQSPEKILSLICRPFNLVYEKQAASEYKILPAR